MIYEPREDSFLIAEYVKRHCQNKNVLDVGTGSGILAETAIKNGAKDALAVDINKEAVDYCRKKGLKVIKSDLFENVAGKFDLIVFNPPYLPADEREDSESALTTTGGEEGDEILIRFFSCVKSYLSKNGIVLVLISYLTPMKRILEIMRKKELGKKILGRKNIFMEKLEVWKVKRQSLKA